MKNIAIYIRVSSKEQSKEGHSLEAQKRALEEYAEYKKWRVHKIYCDAGISGKSIKGRKAFQDMILDAKEGKFSGILVYKFDRAFRNVKEGYMTLDELREFNIDFISITENIDTTTAMGKALFGLISVFAQLERELTAERLNLTLNKKFEDGVMVGKAPLGYKWSKTKKMMVIDNKKAWIIQDIFKMALEGNSYKDICEKHNLKPQSYYNIIRNPVYCGYIEYKGEKKKGNHEPLISEEEFNRIN